MATNDLYLAHDGAVWRIEWVYETIRMAKLKNLDTNRVVLTAIDAALSGMTRLVPEQVAA